MTTPTSESYLKARLDIVKKYEIGAKVDTAFYLDGSGYLNRPLGRLPNI